MTNYEKIKTMSIDEMVECLNEVYNYNALENIWCYDYCELRDKKSDKCIRQEDETCPYFDDKLLIKKWLELEHDA